MNFRLSTFDVRLADSVIGRLDPRWKLGTMLLAGASILFLRTLPASAAAMAGSLALTILAQLPWRWVLARLLTLALVLGPFLLLFPLLRDELPPIYLGPIPLSVTGLQAAGVLALKSVALVLIMLVLTGTTPLPELLKAAQELHVPRLLVYLSLLTYQYVFVMAREFARMRIALRVRGFRRQVSVHGYRTLGHAAGTLLVRGHDRAERVAQAMRCRAFTGQFHTLSSYQTSRRDVTFFLCVAGAAGVVLVSEVLYRYGI